MPAAEASPQMTFPAMTSGAIPAFRPADYTFTLASMDIFNTRSRHEDTDTAALSLAVGSEPAQTVAKSLGDLDNGHFPIGMQLGPVRIADPNVGIAFNYLVVNSGHSSDATIDGVITKAGSKLAQEGAKAATDAIGTAVGSTIAPVIGTILGLVSAWLVAEIVEILTVDCDGPVAAGQPAFAGIDLWAWSHLIGDAPVDTFHPGVPSGTGCGANSQYLTAWNVTRTELPTVVKTGPARALNGAQLSSG
jgi:hypothetical protein